MLWDGLNMETSIHVIIQINVTSKYNNDLIRLSRPLNCYINHGNQRGNKQVMTILDFMNQLILRYLHIDE